MSAEQLIALSLFACVSSITPGPNNMMMLASGVNFGLLRSLPHLAGITIGFCVMIFAVGLGLHTFFERWPLLQEVMRWGGMAYLTWMAWNLARPGSLTPISVATPTAPVSSASAQGATGAAPAATLSATSPMGFWAAAAFQWINPKAWVMALTANTAYLSADPTLMQTLLMVLVFGIINAPCVACWAAFGSAMRRVLNEPIKLRIFNRAMALLLLTSLYPMLMH